MLTPSFDVSQTEASVTLVIRVPYVKISEAEVHVNGTTFKFHCHPYFLHLELPGQVVEDGHENISYDIDTASFTIRVSKCHHGEHFPNLEMLTTLLPRRKRDLKALGKKPLIQVLEPAAAGAEGEGLRHEGGEEEEEEDFDWEVEQTLPEESSKLLSGLVPYGFALQHQGVFLKLQEEIPNIVDCPDPDHMTPHQRRIGRVASEEVSFNQDHYLADLMDNAYISELLAYQPPWRSELVKWKEKSTHSTKGKEPGTDIVPFTADQREKLKNLQNRDYLFDKATSRSLYLGLVDIIFAYAYNFRSTEGEGSVESAWTICKLSCTLSWLEVFRGGLHEVVYCCLRRSLCYPLYRHWGLALAVLQDTRDLFRLGRRKLLQCMLEVRDTLNNCEPYYILNNLYITDYAVWLQKASVKQIQKVADELDEVKVEMGSLGWELEELERAAFLTVKEEEEAAAAAAAGPRQTGLPECLPPEGSGHPEENCAKLKPLIEELEGESTEDSSELDPEESSEPDTSSEESESDSDSTHKSTASEDRTNQT